LPPDGTTGASGPAIPLARWAGRQLEKLSAETGSPRIAALDGQTLLAERGSHSGYRISGKVSAGLGGSHLMQTADGGWFALTLIRQEDRELLPALFGDPDIATDDWDAITASVARQRIAELLERGRTLGLPVASADETPPCPAVQRLATGPHRSRETGNRPLVVDLSAIWAGPLAGHLLWLAGAEVIKVESVNRPDLIRRDDPATFDLINQGKASVVVDLREEADRRALVALIRRADFVIESSRIRALRHLGVDAAALVREVPGLVWLSVTGHGTCGAAADWTGIGNDCGVAGGLSRAMAEAGGEIGYVGDAISDPLTGITAALEGWRAYRAGTATRLAFSMSAIAARALAEERSFDAMTLEAELRGWSAALGQPFPTVARREMYEPARDLGADTTRWLQPC